jgi:hypothetical protein
MILSFDGDDSFDLLAGDPKLHVTAFTNSCASVNPIQDHSPSINDTQERGNK